jgi:branched-chain amino acid transport system substrate-binding protein
MLKPTGLIAQQARKLGFKGGSIAMDQARLDEVARVTNGYAALNGAIGVLPLASDDSPNAFYLANTRRSARTARTAR